MKHESNPPVQNSGDHIGQHAVEIIIGNSYKDTAERTTSKHLIEENIQAAVRAYQVTNESLDNKTESKIYSGVTLIDNSRMAGGPWHIFRKQLTRNDEPFQWFAADVGAFVDNSQPEPKVGLIFWENRLDANHKKPYEVLLTPDCLSHLDDSELDYLVRTTKVIATKSLEHNITSTE